MTGDGEGDGDRRMIFCCEISTESFAHSDPALDSDSDSEAEEDDSESDSESELPEELPEELSSSDDVSE